MAISKINYHDMPSRMTNYLGIMGEHWSSKDFNDYIITGSYLNGGTNKGWTNAPHPADNGYLVVIGDNAPIQLWFGGYQGLVRARCKKPTGWTSWVDVVIFGGG